MNNTEKELLVLLLKKAARVAGDKVVTAGYNFVVVFRKVFLTLLAPALLTLLGAMTLLPDENGMMDGTVCVFLIPLIVAWIISNIQYYWLNYSWKETLLFGTAQKKRRRRRIRREEVIRKAVR